jgi:hypothetical protein
MYPRLSWLFGLGLCLAAVGPTAAQSLSSGAFGRQGSGTERPLDIEIRSSLNFSRATATGANGGQIAIDPDSGARSVSGDIIDLGGSAFAGSAIVTGEPGRAVRIEMPQSIRLASITGGSVQIVNLRTNLPPAPRLDLTGRLEFAFGGDLLIKGAMAGNFRGRIPITAEYE